MNTPPSSETSLPRHPRLLPRFMFWCGAVLFFLCIPSPYPPGEAVLYFALPWCLVSAGLFVPRWRYRIASVALIILPIPAAVSDYQGFIKREHFLKQKDLEYEAYRQKALQQQALLHSVDERK